MTLARPRIATGVHGRRRSGSRMTATRRSTRVSRPEARHSRNLAVRPQLAIVIFDSTVPKARDRPSTSKPRPSRSTMGSRSSRVGRRLAEPGRGRSVTSPPRPRCASIARSHRRTFCSETTIAGCACGSTVSLCPREEASASPPSGRRGAARGHPARRSASWRAGPAARPDTRRPDRVPRAGACEPPRCTGPGPTRPSAPTSSTAWYSRSRRDDFLCLLAVRADDGGDGQGCSRSRRSCAAHSSPRTSATTRTRPHARQGLMREALDQVLDHSFGPARPAPRGSQHPARQSALDRAGAWRRFPARRFLPALPADRRPVARPRALRDHRRRARRGQSF